MELVESMCKDITVESPPSDSIYYNSTYYNPPLRYLTNGVPLTHIYHDIKCLIDENEDLKETVIKLRLQLSGYKND